MGEIQKRGFGIGALVGIGTIIGMLAGGFVAARAMGEADGELSAKVANHSAEIEAIKLEVVNNRAFRETVLQHISQQNERWEQIRRTLYKISLNEIGTGG